MTTRGGIVSVRTEPLGDQLAAAAAAGATSVTVYDTADFEETQGVLQLGDEILGYASLDDETGVITLSTPLAGAHALDDAVLAHPLGTTTTAEVVVEDGGDPISARVPHALVPMLPDGVRSGADEQEAVDLERVGTEWLVSDVVGKTPVQDASFTDPGTLPPDAIEPPEPPAESPTPIVRAFSVLALDAEWDQEPNATEYDVFVSPTPGFAKDATTYFGTVTATHVVITTDPTAGGARLLVQPYYVATIARAVNPAGSAQAAPSGEGSATPRQAGADEISALWAYLGFVETQQIRSGLLDADIVIGGALKTAGLDVSGNQVYPYWTADANGSRAYGPGGADDIRWSMPNDPDLPARTTGISELDRLKVALSASLRGATAFEAGGVITFDAGIVAPTIEPVAGPSYTSSSTGIAGSGTLYHGFFSFDGTYWGTFREPVGDLSVQGGIFVKVHKTTGAATDAFTLPAGFVPFGGGVLFGGFVYVLGQYDPTDAPTRAGQWWVLKYSTAGVKQAAEWQWTPTGAMQGKPALGAWTTASLVIAYQVSGGANQDRFQVTRHVADLGTSTGTPPSFVTDAASSLSPGSGVSSILVDTFDYATTRVLIFARGAQTNMVAVSTSGAAMTATGDRFFLAGAFDTVGVTWDGTRFQQLTQAGTLYPYSTIMWTSGVTTTWVSYTFRDSDAAGTGTHESMESPRAKFAMIQRAYITCSVAGVPDDGGTDDPNTVSFYAARSTSAPARTAMWLQSAPSPPAVQGGAVSARVDAFVTSGTNPPSTSNFPGAAPTYAQTVTGERLFSGDGTSPWAPVGSIALWLSAVPPTGWLKLDGSAVSRTTYARLFTLWGTTYGSGDGSTTFTLPDLRSRFPLGAGSFASVGGHDATGEASRTPRHTHGIVQNTHNHGAGTLAAGTTSDRAAGGLGRANTTITGSTASDSHDHGGNTQLGTVDDIPFFAVNFIVKV